MALLALGAAHAGAQTISGVTADATAENAVLAREQALANARRAAWNRLVNEAGAPPTPLNDAAIDGMVNSIVIESERTTQTRYSGVVTINFNPSRVRAQLGNRAPSGATAGAEGAPPVAGGSPGAPASSWIDVVAAYRSLPEWLELQRRLRAAGPVASVEVKAVAIDAARLRVGLRGPAPTVAEDLGPLGLALTPEPGRGQGRGETWRLGLAGG